jgi:hypothetical protein
MQSSSGIMYDENTKNHLNNSQEAHKNFDLNVHFMLVRLCGGWCEFVPGEK